MTDEVLDFICKKAKCDPIIYTTRKLTILIKAIFNINKYYTRGKEKYFIHIYPHAIEVFPNRGDGLFKYDDFNTKGEINAMEKALAHIYQEKQ